MFAAQAAWGADQPAVPPVTGKLVGEVAFSPGMKIPGPSEMRRIDKLVPLLKKQGAGRMVRIEGFVPLPKKGKPDVRGSLYLAKHVESYLRNRHKLNLDMYLSAINDTIYKTRVVRFTVFDREYEAVKVITSPGGK